MNESQPVDSGPVDFEFTLTNTEENDIPDPTFKIFDSRRPVPDTQLGVYWVGMNGTPHVIHAEVLPEEHRYQWTIRDEAIPEPFKLNKQKPVTLQYIYQQRRPGKNAVKPGLTRKLQILSSREEEVEPIAGVYREGLTEVNGFAEGSYEIAGVASHASPTTPPLDIPISHYVHTYIHPKSVKSVDNTTMVHGKDNKLVDSSDLLSKDIPDEEEIGIVMLQLRYMSEKQHHTAVVWNNLGCAYALLGWFSKAIEAFKRANDTYDDTPDKEAKKAAQSNLKMLKAL